MSMIFFDIFRRFRDAYSESIYSVPLFAMSSRNVEEAHARSVSTGRVRFQQEPACLWVATVDCKHCVEWQRAICYGAIPRDPVLVQDGKHKGHCGSAGCLVQDSVWNGPIKRPYTIKSIRI